MTRRSRSDGKVRAMSDPKAGAPRDHLLRDEAGGAEDLSKTLSRGWRLPAPEIARLVRALAVDDARHDHRAEIAEMHRRRKSDDDGAC